MEKVITLEQTERIVKQLKSQGKRIVLAGGCFDVIHPGHLTYLDNSKKQGDILFVALENDEKVRRLKGDKRPINSQEQRAKALVDLDFVNYVILLPTLSTDEEYAEITKALSPTIIAITEGDPKRSEKERQAALIGAEVSVVTKVLENYSTTQLLKHS